MVWTHPKSLTAVKFAVRSSCKK